MLDRAFSQVCNHISVISRLASRFRCRRPRFDHLFEFGLNSGRHSPTNCDHRGGDKMLYEHVDSPQPIRLGNRGLSAVGSPPQTNSSAETSDIPRRAHLTLVPDPFGLPPATTDDP